MSSENLVRLYLEILTAKIGEGVEHSIISSEILAPCALFRSLRCGSEGYTHLQLPPFLGSVTISYAQEKEYFKRR